MTNRCPVVVLFSPPVTRFGSLACASRQMQPSPPSCPSYRRRPRRTSPHTGGPAAGPTHTTGSPPAAAAHVSSRIEASGQMEEGPAPMPPWRGCCAERRRTRSWPPSPAPCRPSQQRETPAHPPRPRPRIVMIVPRTLPSRATDARPGFGISLVKRRTSVLCQSLRHRAQGARLCWGLRTQAGGHL